MRRIKTVEQRALIGSHALKPNAPASESGLGSFLENAASPAKYRDDETKAGFLGKVPSIAVDPAGSDRSAERPLRVLLISPLPGLDPPGGDRTYTEELLASPPPGVVYETHAEAMAAGRLIERGRRPRDRSVIVRLRHSPAWIRENLVNRGRQRSLLFREPFRFFELVDPAAYDVVHVNTFSVSITPRPTVLVTSNGAPLPDLYRNGYGWSASRVARSARLDRLLARCLGVVHNSLGPGDADRLLCTTDHLRQWYLANQAMPAERIDVVPCGTAAPTALRPAGRRPLTVGFVALNFEAKGGADLLAIWDQVRRAVPEAKLTIVGSAPELAGPDPSLRGITSLGFIDRARLYDEVFPTFDVFAYPSRWDGSALVVQEALGHGIPVVVSDYGPLAEMMGEGTAGAVVAVGDTATLAAAIVDLLDPARNQLKGAAAAAIFADRYELGAAHRRLREAYHAALHHPTDH